MKAILVKPQKDYTPYHVSLLNRELERRKKVNARYSLRAFARYLDLDASALSRILTRKSEISLSTSLRVIKKLKWPADQRCLFIASVAEEKKNRASEFLLDAIFSNESPEETSHLQGILDSGLGLQPEWLLSLCPDLTYVTDSAGRYLYVNEAGARIHNCSPLEMIGKTLQELNLDAHLTESLLAHQRQAILTKSVVRAEVQYPSATSSTRWFEKIVIPICGKDKVVKALVSHSREITERKQAMDRLSQLVAVSRALSSVITLKEAAGVVTSHVLKVIGCKAIVIFLVSDDRKVLFAPDYLEEIGECLPVHRRVNIDEPWPVSQCVRERTPMWIGSIREHMNRYPEFCKMMLELEAQAAAALPLIVDEKVVGVLGVRFGGERHFAEEDRSFMMTIANLCAQAFQRACLFQSIQASASREIELR